jgi:monofunctional biosynthetic peptidoglycan transglycosylase
MDEQNNLIDFGKVDRGAWYAVNDGVMGGVSQGGIRRTDQGTGVFEGILSLENNGGFASVRVVLDLYDLTAYDGLEIRVRGDGRTYQLRLRNDASFDGIAYRANFETRDGEWTTTRIPFDQFLPGFRGRTLSNAAPLDTSKVQQLGFMLADKKPGPFSLEIDCVRVWKSTEVDS